MNKVIIIAEAGVNHNGEIELAKQLIHAAADAGADYIKFQTFITEKNISKEAKKAAYQSINTGNEEESQFDMVKKLELSFDAFLELYEICKEQKIGFLSTAFDSESLDFIASMNLDYLKVPSGELTNKPFLQQIARQGKKLILSTGMASMEEIEVALAVLRQEAPVEVIVLHCNTEYPTPMEDVNLKAMLEIERNLNVTIGYSDHTMGIEVPIAAVALGAKVIEKHFTLDRTMEGPDHAASLEPSELKSMVKSIRNIELAISGDGKKTPSASEQKNIVIARKSIHLLQAMKKGEIIGIDDLIMVRPGDGISPMQIDSVLGKELARDLAAGSKLAKEDLL